MSQLFVEAGSFMVYMTSFALIRCYIPIFSIWGTFGALKCIFLFPPWSPIPFFVYGWCLGTFGPRNPLFGPKKHNSGLYTLLYCAFNPSILINIYVFVSSIIFYTWFYVFYRFCPFWPLIGDCPIPPLKYEIFEKSFFCHLSQIIILSKKGSWKA